jgi:2-succinyl-5-enolpyruvyl-6-hydroxy-3-cyclohexene-1-carboxylate synthase
VVLTETTSNVHPTFINTIDTLITFTNEEFEDFRPEILVTFGGMIVSKQKLFYAIQNQNTTGISTRCGHMIHLMH